MHASELRRDLHHGGWVVVTHDWERMAALATEPPPTPEDELPCPFCPGRESLTPHAIRVGQSAKSGQDERRWSYRVIPARKPILSVEGAPDREGLGLYDRMRGIGAHEVIVEDPDHHARLESYDSQHFCEILHVVRERIRDLERDKRLRLLHYRRRFDPGANGHGAHPHSLVQGAAIIPDRLRMEMSQARAYWQYKDRCVLCDIVREDRKLGDRVVLDADCVIATTPYASAVPFEVHVIPTRHCHAYAQAQPEEIDACAAVIRQVWNGLVRLLPGWRLTLLLDTARTEIEAPGGWKSIRDDYHWHFEIHPSPPVIPPAWTDFAGLPVCVVPPEEAAPALREACQAD